jgi:esterase/lipase superfamily enzyme
MTLYASTADKAIRASRQVHKYPRAGESGPNLVILPAFVDTIDASKVQTELGIDHSYFAETKSILQDIFNLVRFNRDPSDRFGLLIVQGLSGSYWEYQP